MMKYCSTSSRLSSESHGTEVGSSPVKTSHSTARPERMTATRMLAISASTVGGAFIVGKRFVATSVHAQPATHPSVPWTKLENSIDERTLVISRVPAARSSTSSAATLASAPVRLSSLPTLAAASSSLMA